MTGRSIVRIEQNDSDLRFRDKVNANFAALSSRQGLDAATIQLIGDSDVVADILLAMNEKVARSVYDTDMALRRAGHVDQGGLTLAGLTSVVLGPISFGLTYANAPKVVLTSYTQRCFLSLEVVTTTGFTYRAYNMGPSESTINTLGFDWMAMP